MDLHNMEFCDIMMEALEASAKDFYEVSIPNIVCQ